MRYELEPLSKEELATWDERIAGYESTQLFHRQAWLDHIGESRGVKIHQWAIRESGRTVGYFCAGIFTKGPFRILGSPMKGWASNFMGPVVNSDYDQDAFLGAIDELAKSQAIATLEIENPLLRDEQMSAHGYDSVAQPTYVVKLTPYDEAPAWELVNPKARQNVRKARRAGCTVVEASDPSMVEEFYDEFVEVLARKGLFPPYGRGVPRSLFKCLYRNGLLLPLQVKDPEGQVIATCLFPHDDKTIYYWCGGSRLSGWKYSPNDLIHWSAIEWGIKNGLTAYNMCGYGNFKSKFGGPLEEPRRWQKYYSTMARWGRAAYARYHTTRIKVRGNWERLKHPSRETA
jgi:CelD/BcsL family acetyltransferase involved in cellulose biosynthesis